MSDLAKLVDPRKVGKLRRAARNYACVLCFKDRRFTVAAHDNALASGRGVGRKAPGVRIAYVCGDPGGCHDRMDGRAGGLSKEEKRSMFYEAHSKTVSLWFRDGLVEVA